MKHLQQFTKQHAKTLVGRHVRAKGNCDAIPRDTLGHVIRMEECQNHPGDYELVVRWNLPPRSFCGRERPVDDWFPLFDFEAALEVVPFARAYKAAAGGSHVGA